MICPGKYYSQAVLLPETAFAFTHTMAKERQERSVVAGHLVLLSDVLVILALTLNYGDTDKVI
jgi:hypothetical protein